MKKLNLNALKERAQEIASEELMSTINGGLQNACHQNCQPIQTPPSGNGSANDLIASR